VGRRISDNTLEVRHLVSVPAFADGRLLDVATAVAAGTHVPLPARRVLRYSITSRANGLYSVGTRII